MGTSLYLKPKIVGITIIATLLIAILLSAFFKLPVLYVELNGAEVDYSAEYPRESFENKRNQQTGLEKMKFNTHTGKVPGSKIIQRMKFSAIINSDASTISQWITATNPNKSKKSLTEGELIVFHDCMRNKGCGNSEFFEPQATHVMRNLIPSGEREGGLRAIKDSASEMTRLNHWINRTRYYDRVLYPDYEMQTVEIALITPNFIFSVGKSKPDLEINGKDIKMNEKGYLSFVKHNLSTGTHEITLDENKTKINFHGNVPKISYSDYSSRDKVIMEKNENQSLNFERVLISSDDKIKSVEIDFERNRSWNEEFPFNPNNRMEIPFNGSAKNTTVTLTNSKLNYTEKLVSVHGDNVNIERHILGLRKEEMETFQRLSDITGRKVTDY